MFFKKALLPALLIVSLAACDKMGGNASEGSQPATASTAAAAAPSATEQAAPAATADEDASKVGIAECDDYLSKVKACIASKVPEAQRGTFDQAMNTTAEQWKTVAKSGGKDALAAQCKQVSDASKQTYTAFGCDM